MVIAWGGGAVVPKTARNTYPAQQRRLFGHTKSVMCTVQFPGAGLLVRRTRHITHFQSTNCSIMQARQACVSCYEIQSDSTRIIVYDERGATGGCGSRFQRVSLSYKE